MAEASAPRTDAASIVAELWAEREQERSAGSARPDGSPARPPKPPRPKADGRQRALAAAITLVLVGGVLGVVATSLGVIGAPSKAQFVADADAVCAATNGTVNAISKPIAYPALAAAASTLVTTSETQLDRLRDLDLPGGDDRGRARAVFTALQTTNDAGRNLQSAAGAGDPAMTAAASRTLSLNSKDAQARAREFGLTACVVGMQTGTDAVLAGANGAVKDSFLVAGSRLCVDFLRDLEAVPTIRNANDITRFVNQNVTLVDKLVSDLRALPVAPGDENTVAELTAAVENLSGKLKQMGVAGAAGDVRRVNAIQREIDAAGVDVDTRFGNYGLRAGGSAD